MTFSSRSFWLSFTSCTNAGGLKIALNCVNIVLGFPTPFNLPSCKNATQSHCNTSSI